MIHGFILDTCALSEPLKPNPDIHFIKWLSALEKEGGLTRLFISVLSIGEIQKGISKIKDTKRKNRFIKFLRDTEEMFQGRILTIQPEIAKIWGGMEGVLVSKGKHCPAIDGLIAATAIHHSLTLVTRNVDDFHPIIKNYHPDSKYEMEQLIINPWEKNS